MGKAVTNYTAPFLGPKRTGNFRLGEQSLLNATLLHVHDAFHGSLMHSAVSTKRSVDGCKSVGYAASVTHFSKPSPVC